ncbi:hypothetical protein A6R68_20458 [Neotoma lepida]|uniref:BPTI/Kunitz inhibitor domain-containing protein n=1 Tax=Neotoma lepida TaxID=56216 RepID=A0A1A6HSW8_NEOLE|nr:hypothetical protein A6R68_20458 [Neotoma lepida]
MAPSGLHFHTISGHRYYYNKMSSSCEPFIFSGCGGNRNNFKSKYLCEFYCIFKKGLLQRRGGEGKGNKKVLVGSKNWVKISKSSIPN